MVSQGCGDNQRGRISSKEKVQISNEFDSHCSSLGECVIRSRRKSVGNKSELYFAVKRQNKF